MRRTALIILSLAVCIGCNSCGQSGTKQSPSESKPLDALSFIDSLKVGEPFHMCEQKYTSLESVRAAFPDDRGDDYFHETTPAERAFFNPPVFKYPAHVVENVLNRYNSIAVINRIQHSYELVDRALSAAEDTPTRADTLKWIRASRPNLAPFAPSRIIPDSQLLKDAVNYFKAYSNYKGEPLEDSDLAVAHKQFIRDIQGIPPLVDTTQAREFKRNFWKWYDKEPFVPGIDEVIKMHLQDTGKVELSEERLSHLRNAVLSEKDIDRRAILALEYEKFDGRDGSVLLGEIIESRIYTRYLLEVWISWRAHVQMEHSPSSFSIIPNNYYDRMRVLCMETLLSDYRKTESVEDLMMLENFIYADILHRRGSIAGNESLATIVNLNQSMFIHPRLTGE